MVLLCEIVAKYSDTGYLRTIIDELRLINERYFKR
ncbi:MAG: hypothetical protein ACI9T9_000326 [Oleiphilaceae bacterium]|jgi:hypothetical protein